MGNSRPNSSDPQFDAWASDKRMEEAKVPTLLEKYEMDMEKLRKFFYKKYMRLLTAKIEKQKVEIDERWNVNIKRLAKQASIFTEEELSGEQPRKPPLPRGPPPSECEAPRFEKSDLYRIIAKQRALEKEGKLRYQEDYDQFWTEALSGGYETEDFPDESSEDEKISSMTRNSTTPRDPTTARPRTTTKTAGEGMSRGLTGTSVDDWAVTQKAKAKYSKRKSKDVKDWSFWNQAYLQADCKKMHLPELSCHILDDMSHTQYHSKKELTPDERVIWERAKRRRKFSIELAAMTQLARANCATAGRMQAVLPRRRIQDYITDVPAADQLVSMYMPRSKPAKFDEDYMSEYTTKRQFFFLQDSNNTMPDEIASFGFLSTCFEEGPANVRGSISASPRPTGGQSMPTHHPAKQVSMPVGPAVAKQSSHSLFQFENSKESKTSKRMTKPSKPNLGHRPELPHGRPCEPLSLTDLCGSRQPKVIVATGLPTYWTRK